MQESRTPAKELYLSQFVRTGFFSFINSLAVRVYSQDFSITSGVASDIIVASGGFLLKKINLRIAELRQAKKITQKELAQIAGVSFQTVSKWKNGTVLPDITYLPILAEYFGVSVDQLMGIVPLDGEEYIEVQTGTGKFWEKKLEYLLRTRKSAWNNDYMEFLVEKVWKIDRPVKVLDWVVDLVS